MTLTLYLTLLLHWNALCPRRKIYGLGTGFWEKGRCLHLPRGSLSRASFRAPQAWNQPCGGWDSCARCHVSRLNLATNVSPSALQRELWQMIHFKFDTCHVFLFIHKACGTRKSVLLSRLKSRLRTSRGICGSPVWGIHEWREGFLTSDLP